MATELFVFRHCLRSTPPRIHNADPSRPELDDARNFSSVPLPEWGVPSYWCTEGGMSAIEDTGRWLARLVDPDAIVSLVADASMRDVDSSLALARGLSSEGLVSSQASYRPELFSTLDPEWGAPRCSMPATAEVAAEAGARLASIPQPPAESIDALERSLGVGAAGSLAGLPAPAVMADGIAASEGDKYYSSEWHLAGGVNAYKRLGQQLFYAWASRVRYPLLGAGPTVREMYAALQWQHYARAVKDVNSNKATDNAWLAGDLLRRLGEEGGRARLVAYLGHDGNLNGLAGLLGIDAWLAPPYASGPRGEYMPTPPGSALRFSRPAGKSEVEVSLVYPSFAPSSDDLLRDTEPSLGRPLQSTAPLLSLPLPELRARVQANAERFAGGGQPRCLFPHQPPRLHLAAALAPPHATTSFCVWRRFPYITSPRLTFTVRRRGGVPPLVRAASSGRRAGLLHLPPAHGGPRGGHLLRRRLLHRERRPLRPALPRSRLAAASARGAGDQEHAGPLGQVLHLAETAPIARPNSWALDLRWPHSRGLKRIKAAQNHTPHTYTYSTVCCGH